MNLSVVIGSTEYVLDDGTYGVLTGHDGWGMAPQHRLAQRGAQQHGDTDLGYRLDPRFGTLIFRQNARTQAAMYTQRAALLRLFLPQNAPVLKWVLDYGTRCIACVYDSDMSLPWATQDWTYQVMTLRLKASDPTFYDPELQSVPFALSASSSALTVPLSVPMFVGQSTLNQVVSITYAGELPAYPDRIRIIGPITDATIENETTGDVLDFTGTTIAAGEYFDIDCRYGYKSVVDQDGDNQIACLTEDSDLATFRLVPAEDGGASRVNDIRVTGNTVTAATKVYLNYYRRYAGI